MTCKLKTINIFNFKSFKDNHTVSGIDNHFTAIVGPNGSGKSNIIDSILFVLGFKAKKMRHAILKDLITEGCTECYVELFFTGFSIKRSLKGRIDNAGVLKSVMSKYEIDGTEVSANDAITFLKNKGIDLDNNRFLILQGEIETIAMMSPLELLDYIEDCIGSSSLKPDIEALGSEIKKNQEDYDTLLNNLKFVETDYLFKKGRRDEKAELLAHRSESLRIKNRIVLIKEELANRKEKAFSEEKKAIEEKLKTFADKNSRAIKEIKNLEYEAQKLELKAKEEKLVIYRNEYHRIERESKTKDAKRKRIENNLQKLQGELQDSIEADRDWKRESKALQKSFESNRVEISNIVAKNERNMEELEKFEQIKKNEKQKKAIEERLLILIHKKESLDAEKSTIKVLRDKVVATNEKIDSLGSINDISEEKYKIEEEVRIIKSDMNATLQEINRRRSRVREFEMLEESYKREREVVENLKSIPGVFGVLKDLGQFEKKYSEAIEASAKGLNSIVVDSTKTAEECISVISRKRLNRTTFIVLERLPSPSDFSISGAEILYKKVRCDERFTKCFYYSLKDTYCVDSIEKAKKLAFGQVRRRVVTLDGKLLEKSGVMSGGKAIKKLKSASELEEIYRNMQSHLEKKTAQLNEISYTETQKGLLGTYMNQVEQLNGELRKRIANFEESKLIAVEEEVKALRIDLKALEDAELPSKAIKLKNEIQQNNEKAEGMQKINQEIKLRLAAEPSRRIEWLEAEIKKLEQEYSSFKIDLLPDAKELAELETCYSSACTSNTKIQSRISEIRSAMGEDYHEEATCKARDEEIVNSLQEALKSKKNCEKVKREVLNDFELTKSLLMQINPQRLIEPETELFNLEEFENAELKQKCKTMLEELNEMESTIIKKLKKHIHGGEDPTAEEDLGVYRAIFEEYEKSKRAYDEMKGSCDFLSGKLEKMKVDLETLKSNRISIFIDGFTVINKHIKEIFNLITFGGNAELDLLDYLNPFNDGIVLSIMPPKKAWKQVSHLSGGEKTLSSLALIFALHKYKPSSFYIMDEIDAALDFKNVSIISQYLSHIEAQFVIISLRNDMFEIAKTLVGVYKVNNASKAITVNLDKLFLCN
ncbi:Structural maintenance of chromosomes protein 4 [Glugoides intestinalis]